MLFVSAHNPTLKGVYNEVLLLLLFICYHYYYYIFFFNINPAEYARMKGEHLNLVWTERHGYEERIVSAKHYPLQSMSIVIDGADNQAYGFPYFPEKTKMTEEGHKVKSKLYGVIVHGVWQSIYTYGNHLVGGSNVTVEVLHRTLHRFNVTEKRLLPPVLHIQLDNTSK